MYCKPYTMPFARRVLSHFHTYVLPSSPRNYNALYRIISRRPFRCIRAAFAVCSRARCIVAMLRRCVDVGRIYSGGLVSLAALNAARAADAKIIYLLRVWRNI